MIYRGEVKLVENSWQVKAEPHVLMRIKAVISKINLYAHGYVKFSNTPENCRELEWFLMRYPLPMEDEARNYLASQSIQYQTHLERMDKILTGEYKPRDFAMALPPREYQKTAAELWLQQGYLLLADDVGLGKTVSAITAFTDKDVLPVAVVCQAHLPYQWRDMIRKFLPTARIHVVKSTSVYNIPPSTDIIILSYSKLPGWAHWLTSRVKAVVYDEVQELRRVQSQKYVAAKLLSDSIQYTMGLSATPIYNYGGEMYNVLDLIKDGCLGSVGEFKKEWCRGFYGSDGKLKIHDPKAFGTYLQESHLMLRRTRKEVGRELPPIEKILYPVESDEKELDKIKDSAVELAKLILHGSFTQRGRAARELDWRVRQQTGIAKAPYVARFVEMLIEEGEKVLLFGWHREVYEIWNTLLKEHNPVMFTGSENDRQKRMAKEKFIGDESKVMIMSLRSGSGLDGLQHVCNVAVFGELDWSPGVHDQCIGRIHRDGKEGNTTAFFLMADNGSDPVIADVLGIKRMQAEGVINPQKNLVEALTTDEDKLKLLAQHYLNKYKH